MSCLLNWLKAGSLSLFGISAQAQAKAQARAREVLLEQLSSADLSCEFGLDYGAGAVAVLALEARSQKARALAAIVPSLVAASTKSVWPSKLTHYLCLVARLN